MKYSISFVSRNNVAVVKTSGNMSGYDYIAMAKELLKEQKWLPHNHVIFDHRDLYFDVVGFSDIELIRRFHAANEKKIGGGKSAIVLKHGLSSAWQRLWTRGEPVKTKNEVKIFENYEDALRWVTSKPLKE